MVKIHLEKQGSGVTYTNVKNCYQKGSMYCVEFINDEGSRKVHKYPIDHIFRTEEPY